MHYGFPGRIGTLCACTQHVGYAFTCLAPALLTSFMHFFLGCLDLSYVKLNYCIPLDKSPEGLMTEFVQARRLHYVLHISNHDLGS